MLKTLKTIVLSWVATILLFLASFIQVSPAFAHALETNYGFDLIKSALTFTTGFSTGEPFVGGVVEIYAPGDTETPWETLTTDESGQFSFLPDAQKLGEWTVKIGQEGHSDMWTIPVTTQGVEFEEISEGLTTDIHYAGFRSGWLGLASALLGGLLYFAYTSWKGMRTRSIKTPTP